MATYEERTGLTLLAGATDPDGDPVFVSRVNGSAANVGQPVTLASGATVTVAADGTVTLDDSGLDNPAAGETIIAGSFTYRLSDGQAESAEHVVTVEVTGVAAAPAAFTAGQWSLADAGTGGTLMVTVLALPADGGSAITDIQYQLGGSGPWTSLGGATAGSWPISGLVDGTAYDVRLRAVNAVGPGAAGDSKTATPTAGAASGATFTGGVMSGTVDLSGLTPGAGVDAVEWRVCPAWGDVDSPVWPSTPQILLNPVVPVASLGTPVSVPWIAVPGDYVVYTREISGGTPGPWSAASAPGTVTAPAAVTGKSWYASVAALMGPNALGATVGRTSTNPLTLIDAYTMSAAAISAALPSGWTFNSTNSTISPPSGASASNPAVLEDYELRGVRITISAGRDHVHIRQCLIYPADLGGNATVLIFRGGRLREFSHNTVIGPRFYDGSGQVVQCQYPFSSGQGRGIVDEIAWNFITGMSGDCFSVTGSPVTRTGGQPNGTWVHHNVLDAVAYVTGFPGSSGKTGNWHDTANAPHGDLITVKGSYDQGVRIEDNVFWQIPVEPVSIPASLSHDGVAKVAGAARPFAGSRGNPLGNDGHSSQNNIARIVQDNGQYVDASTWAGPVRVTRFIHSRWAGMSGLPFDHSAEALAASDVAVWDGIAAGSDPGQAYGAANFTNTTRTTLNAYFLDNPTYTAGLVNFWTGAAIAGVGTAADLTSAL